MGGADRRGGLLAYVAWFVPAKEELSGVPTWLTVASLQCHVEGVYGARKLQLSKMPHTLGVAAACHTSCQIWGGHTPLGPH